MKRTLLFAACVAASLAGCQSQNDGTADASRSVTESANLYREAREISSPYKRPKSQEEGTYASEPRPGFGVPNDRRPLMAAERNLMASKDDASALARKIEGHQNSIDSLSESLERNLRDRPNGPELEALRREHTRNLERLSQELRDLIEEERAAKAVVKRLEQYVTDVEGRINSGQPVDDPNQIILVLESGQYRLWIQDSYSSGQYVFDKKVVTLRPSTGGGGAARVESDQDWTIDGKNLSFYENGRRVMRLRKTD